MTVLMVMRVQGDAAKFESYAQEHQDELQGLVGRGRDAGAIHHAFYGDDNGVVVIDEWPDEESFNEFIGDEQEIVQQMIDAADGGEPEIKFYRKLDTRDDF